MKRLLSKIINILMLVVGSVMIVIGYVFDNEIVMRTGTIIGLIGWMLAMSGAGYDRLSSVKR